MEILNKPAEGKLLEMALKLQHRQTEAYCILFHLSKLHYENRGSDALALLNLVKEEISDIEGGIYLCSDFDLFVILKTTKNKLIDKIISKVRFFYSDDPLTCGGIDGKAQEFTTVFNVNKEYEDFFFACNNKAIAYKKAEEAKKQELQSKEAKKSKEHSWSIALQNRRSRGNKLCILIIEDQDFSRQLLKDALGREHVTLAAKNAMEGIELYMTNAPDIVFLDIELPDYDGHYVLHHILNNDPHGFVVMTTANNSKEYVERSIFEGARGYIVKPFTKGKIDQYIDLYFRKFKDRH